MALRGKMDGYARARAQGMRPLDAAAMAGYAGGGIRVTVSRLEKRTDIQQAIREYKKSGAAVDDTPELGRLEWGLKDRYENPLALMLDVMNNPDAPKSIRYQAAKDAMPYCHPRKEGGKKDAEKERAKAAAKGRFGTQSRPSHLQAVK